MAEPLDYFFQGANLGMRAGAARTQQEQFRTNLAENARQFDQSFSLQEEANKAAVARDRAYTQKLNFDLKQQEESSNRITAQLDKLAAYKTSVREAADNYLLKLPLPPSGLQGDILKEAQSYYTSVDKDRQSDAAFKKIVRDREDLVDLIENYGLDPSFLERAENFELTKQDTRVGLVPIESSKPPIFNLFGANANPFAGPVVAPQDELREAFMRRSVSKAESIASEFGVDPSEFSDVRVLLPFLDNKGDLDEDRFRARVAALPQATKTVSSRTVSSTGAISETINLKKPSNKKEPAEVRLERIKTLLPEVKDILGELDVPKLETLLEYIETGEGLEKLANQNSDDDSGEELTEEQKRYRKLLDERGKAFIDRINRLKTGARN